MSPKLPAVMAIGATSSRLILASTNTDALLGRSAILMGADMRIWGNMLTGAFPCRSLNKGENGMMPLTMKIVSVVPRSQPSDFRSREAPFVVRTRLIVAWDMDGPTPTKRASAYEQV